MLTARDFLEPVQKPEDCLSRPLDQEFWVRLEQAAGRPWEEQSQAFLGVFGDYVSPTATEIRKQENKRKLLASQPLRERQRIAKEFVELIADSSGSTDLRERAAIELLTMRDYLALGAEIGLGESLLAIWHKEFPRERLVAMQGRLRDGEFPVPGIMLLTQLTFAVIAYTTAAQSEPCIYQVRDVFAGTPLACQWNRTLEKLERKRPGDGH